MARYKDVPWSIFDRTLPSGAHVWYYYWYDEAGRRQGPKSTGIGYRNSKHRSKTKREAHDYCATLFRADRLHRGTTAPTLARWVESVHFFDWDRSKYVRGILARSEKDRPGITEAYLKTAFSAWKHHIEPLHGEYRLDQITAGDLDDFLFTLKGKGLAHKSVNNIRSVYSTILGEAARLDIIELNPWNAVQQLRSSSTHRGGLTLDEGKLIMGPSKIDKSSRRELVFHTATRLAFVTGLRIAEIVGLLVGDVKSRSITRGETVVTVYFIDVVRQLNNRTKKLSQVKDKDARAIPISERFYRELEPYLQVPADRFLFSAIDPKQRMPITQNALRSWFNERLDALEIDREERNIVFHSTRRFFNTLLRRNVSDDVVRRMTGHDSDEMTESYTDYLPEDLLQITAAVEGLDDD
jgi:integrase